MPSYTLLLTSCVSPCDGANTVISDSQTRLSHYLDALKYYCENTILKIVIVDNSSFDFSDYIPSEYKHRIECLSFEGIYYPDHLGKGYGEGRILNFAFLHSTTIRNSDYIIKITGRHIVLNIRDIIQVHKTHSNFRKNLIVGQLFPGKQWATSDIFIANYSFFTDFISATTNVDDSAFIFFEHILFNSIKDHVCIGTAAFIHIPFAIRQRGISGSNGKKLGRMGGRLRSLLKYLVFLLGLHRRIWKSFKY